jgi:hypothetical protein
VWTFADGSPTPPDRVRRRRRNVIWLALIPAAFACYFWLPWPSTWIEMGLLLGLIVCLFVIELATRF